MHNKPLLPALPQVMLLREMVTAGEPALAADYRQQLGLDDSVLSIDPAAVAAAEAQRRDQYLQLGLPPEAVVVVDRVEQLEGVGAKLAAAPAVGLDVEW